MYPFQPIFSRPFLWLIALCSILLIVSGCAASTSATASAPTTPGTSAATNTSIAISTPTISGTSATSTPAPASTPTSFHQGTLEGTVLAAPVCPGPQAEEPACPARPLPNLVVLIEQANGSVVATVTTDSAGHFSYMLSSGKYVLSVRHAASALIGEQQTTVVTINAEQTTTVRIIIDTGMR